MTFPPLGTVGILALVGLVGAIGCTATKHPYIDLDASRPRDTAHSIDAGESPDATPADDAGRTDSGSGLCVLHARGPLVVERGVPGWDDRRYDLRVPSGYDCTVPVPVLLVLHGGGSNKDETHLLTCPGTDPRVRPTDPYAPGCLDATADAEGVVVVYPNGTRNPALAREVRTFAAGGGADGYECVSGYACEERIDDVGYFRDLLDDLETVLHVDRARVFATGISNGGAMAHRLACELGDRIAAIAPIAGGNQLEALDACEPPRAVSVLQIHGDADRGWPYLGGPGRGVICTLAACEDMVGIPDRTDLVRGPSTMAGWITRNGCDPMPTTHALPDLDVTDGSTIVANTWAGCDDGASVVLYTVIGGGHTWPGGFQYAASAGATNRDIDASRAMIEFFRETTGDWPR